MHLLMPKVSRTPTQNKCLITVMDLILPFYILDRVNDENCILL